MTDRARAGALPRGLTTVFGLVVITSFGTWFYGYGVLVEPVVRDTGWSEGALSTAYGVGLLLVGIGSVVAGRALDRIGPRPVFLVGAAGVAAGGAVTSAATDVALFVVAASVTHCCAGAPGYYFLVHATIARLVPEDRTRLITVNTLWGAFSSPLFLPLMAWLAVELGWRTALGVGNALTAAAFLAAAVLVPATAPAADTGASRGLLGGLAAAVRLPAVPRLLAVAALGGAACSVLILYQVPGMVAAGLALGTASALAGVRGLFQLTGRLPLPWLVRRFGSRRVFQVSLALLGLSVLLLPASGAVAVALGFAAVAGFGVGAFTTLESVFASEVAPAATIGTVVGAYALVRGLGSAVGPAGAGYLTDLSGSRVPALVGVAVLALLGALAVPRRPADGPAALH